MLRLSPTLEESLVLQCDDTYLSGIDLLVPGELTYEGTFVIGNYVSYEGCDVDWSVSDKKIVTKNNQKYTLIRFEAGSSCILKVQQKGTAPQEPKYFIVDIGDGC